LNASLFNVFCETPTCNIDLGYIHNRNAREQDQSWVCIYKAKIKKCFVMSFSKSRLLQMIEIAFTLSAPAQTVFAILVE